MIRQFGIGFPLERGVIALQPVILFHPQADQIVEGLHQIHRRFIDGVAAGAFHLQFIAAERIGKVRNIEQTVLRFDVEHIMQQIILFQRGRHFRKFRVLFGHHQIVQRVLIGFQPHIFDAMRNAVEWIMLIEVFIDFELLLIQPDIETQGKLFSVRTSFDDFIVMDRLLQIGRRNRLRLAILPVFRKNNLLQTGF